MNRVFQRYLIGVVCTIVLLQSSIAASVAIRIVAIAQAGASSSTALPECPDPGICFMSGDARNDWAKANNCQFSDVKCEDTERQADSGGLVATVGAMARFAQGLVDGLAQQLGDIWNFFRSVFANPSQVWNDLKALGKAIIEEPIGALQAVFDLLGDDVNRFRLCGAYDRGKVLGEYVSPFFALKVAKIVARGGKTIREAAEDAKKTKVGPEGGPPRIPGSIVRLDVKQPDGRSWFELTDATERGREIERMLGYNLPLNFPGIDRISGRVVTQTKSYDISPATTMVDPLNWRKRLHKDILDLAKWDAGEKPWESTSPFAGQVRRVKETDYDKKVLEVVVKKGEMTEGHYAILQQARAYAKQQFELGNSKKAIEIIVIEIP